MAFSPHTEPLSPQHPHPGTQSRWGRALCHHPLSCFCLVHTAGCQKGLSSGTASLESLRQLSSRHSSEHTYATLSQLSSSRVKHDPPAAPPVLPQPASPSPPLTEPAPGGQQGAVEKAGQ